MSPPLVTASPHLTASSVPADWGNKVKSVGSVIEPELTKSSSAGSLKGYKSSLLPSKPLIPRLPTSNSLTIPAPTTTMSTSPQKAITIIGATGTQGSSVARTFLSLSNWHVRCITRTTSSPRANALSALGATLIQADLNDIVSLKTAFANTHAIFVNTDFWGLYRATPPSKDASHSAYAQEIQQGKNAALAASTIPTLERYIYSALGPMKKHSGGKYPHSYHWDSKAEIVEFIEKELPGLAQRTSFVYLGVYVSNPLFMPRVDARGRLKFVVPLERGVRVPVFDAGKATGGFVRKLVEDEKAGVKLLACCAWLEVREMVNVWTRVTGREAEVVEVTPEWMNRELGVPMEVLDAPAFIEEFGYMGGLEGWVEPGELREGWGKWSFEEWLRGEDWEGILRAGMEELDGVTRG